MKAPLSDSLRGKITGSNLTVNEIARQSGVPQPVLSRFINGKRSLRLETVDRLANYFGLRLSDDLGHNSNPR